MNSLVSQVYKYFALKTTQAFIFMVIALTVYPGHDIRESRTSLSYIFEHLCLSC